MKNIIVIINIIKPYHFQEIIDLASNYEVKKLSDISESDYSRIEVLYGYDAALGEKLVEVGAPALKWVQAPSAGINSLPESWLNDASLLITNMSGIHAIPIAETVFGYMLGYVRDFPLYVKQQTKADFTDHDASSLTDKSIIIFGAGSIGKEIARLAKAFRMNTIGVNTSGREVEHFDTVYKSGGEMPLLADINFIVNVLPLTPATTGYFDAEFFEGLNSTPLFINVGRGGAVEEEVLLDALAKEQLGYAALDVFHEEPLPSDHPFWLNDKIFITPHISGRVEHFAIETFKVFEPNLKSYLANSKPSINLVNHAKGY